jgi:hypothetical protein
MAPYGRVATMIAIVLLLAPVANEIDVSRSAAGIEQVKLVYPPCATANQGQTCFDGHRITRGTGQRPIRPHVH